MRLISMTSTPQASARSRWLLPMGASAAVVAVVAAVVGVVSVVGGNGPSQPPVLHLSSLSGGAVGLSLGATAAAADLGGAPVKGGAPVSGAGGSGWRLGGSLPTGPATAQVHLLPAGPTTRTFVSALAHALGMSGQPQHLKDGWYLVSGTTELSVSELTGQQWTYANHGCVVGPMLDPRTGAGCATAQSSPQSSAKPVGGDAPVSSGADLPPTAGAPGPFVEPIPFPESGARRLARPVFVAVGVNPDAAKAITEGGQRSLVFSANLAGSTVLGLDTRVSLDEQGKIVDASGWLAKPVADATYPLISARQAYDQLLRQPQPMMALAMPCRIVTGTQGCAPIPDRVVTGATLGLTQAFSTDRGILLVPAWLFQIRDQAAPMAVVAVQRSFLGQPDQPAPGGGPAVGGGSGSVGSAGSERGSVGSGGSDPGRVGGAGAPNGSTAVTGAPNQVEKGGPAMTPATPPTQSPR